MAAAVRQDRSATYAALGIAVLIHAAILAIAAYYAAHQPPHMGDVTTVTLVTSADLASLRAAEQAPQTTPAATPEPTPEAPPQAAPPAPTPPTPTPPTPAKPAKPEPAFDPDSLSRSLSQASKSAAAHPSSAQRGAARPQTAPQATAGHGSGTAPSSNDMASLRSQLMRLWHPNCADVGRTDVNILVKFTIGPTGMLTGDPTTSADDSRDPVVVAARNRAKSALTIGQPYRSLPRSLYNYPLTYNFDARAACNL
jgi:outer membrane biosynthesis protein TonB